MSKTSQRKRSAYQLGKQDGCVMYTGTRRMVKQAYAYYRLGYRGQQYYTPPRTGTVLDWFRTTFHMNENK